MATPVFHQFEPIPQYESSSRLASKKYVKEVCDILGIDPTLTTNNSELPRPLGGGAGRVKKFQPGESREFVERTISTLPERPRLDPKTPEGATFTSLEKWLHHETNDTFEISPQDVRKRAAWSWWRTAKLLRQSADKYSEALDDSQVSGPRTFESTMSLSNEQLLKFKQALTMKAERAMNHATKLNSDLVPETDINLTNFPYQWGSKISQKDIEYYREIDLNNEFVTRSKMAKAYEDQSWLYAQEALLLYAEEAQEAELKGHVSRIRVIPPRVWPPLTYQTGTRKQGTDIEQYTNEAMDNSGSLSRLWAKAAEWGVHMADSFHAYHFRSWWIRAAMAKGHAEWLLKEPLPQFRQLLHTGTKVTAPWRLIPPPPISYYDNDCGPQSLLAFQASEEELFERAGKKLFPHFPDDEYYTKYNLTSHHVWELQSMIGDPEFSFLYGCPDFVFTEKAKTGWERERLGLFPTDHEDYAFMVGFHEYYCRKGLIDQLPVCSAPYEKALAVCVDDVFLARSRSLTQEIILLNSNPTKAVVNNIIAALEILYARRLHMTFCEARAADFDGAVYDLVQTHIASLQLQFPCGIEDTKTLLCIQDQLKYPLLPWFQLSLMCTRTHIPSVLLRSCTTGRIHDLQHPIPPNISNCWTLTHSLRYFFVTRIYHICVSLGHRIVHEPERSGNISMIYLRFAFVFRPYLETGCDSRKMPYVTSGLLESREHDVPYLDWQLLAGIHCAPDCTCPMRDREAQMRSKLRDKQGTSLAARTGRLNIVEWFNGLEKDGINIACMMMDRAYFAA
ncbi:uncharacterized protein BKA55DRAFT_546991 [Fusarium redolens]|uniref:Uncharacterized protein n=1 Tax=Fusarium redolens TaxID=48865 RepID=A0A9P9FUV4_FUSRE|nr:uncharacterized protein BKA55DRAFT_546991 [Fusarium redolens]KAH7207914.1 hypothetical protein BKA55DRAFT_546991 [Fusarium redolens]